ncbi:MAG: hypothetical protein ABIR68_08690 [Ilumatobacteraceae bacterium]
MTRNVARHLDVLEDDLDRVAHDVELIVTSVRNAGNSTCQLDSLEVDVLLRVARVRQHLLGLRNEVDQAS